MIKLQNIIHKGLSISKTICEEHESTIFLGSWILFAILLLASWYIHPLFSLCSFVPYLVNLFRKKQPIIYYLRLYVLNITWNLTVTYWLCLIRPSKGIGTILINSFLFLMPVFLWQGLNKYCKLKYGKPAALLILWILFEYGHHIWDFSWTWLTIGNVFGQSPQWVSWYSYFGVLGGSTWILCCNYLVYLVSQKAVSQTGKVVLITTILLPLLFSIVIVKVKIRQPDLGQKNILLIGTAEKGEGNFSDIRRMKMIDTILTKRTGKNADISILPESILFENVWLNRFPESEVFRQFKSSIKTWRADHIIVGAVLNVSDTKGQHEEERMGIKRRYNQYNAALKIDNSDIIRIKLKKVFVPVEEYIPPYLSFLNFDSFGFSKELNNSDIFEANHQRYFIGICYEAVNSIFLASRLNKNVNAMVLLSSEAFFGSMEVGRKQYMNICRLRCVENNLSLLKSSNNGIVFSADHLGNIVNEKRVYGNYLMETTTILRRPSVYHLLVPYIFPLLLFALSCVIGSNIYLQKQIKGPMHKSEI